MTVAIGRSLRSRRLPKDTVTAWLDARRDAATLTVLCTRCPKWHFTGTAADARAAFQTHRANHDNAKGRAK